MNRTHRGEWGQETLIDLLVARAATCGHFRRCQGHWSKGDHGSYWNSELWYKETRVKIRPHLISFITPLPQWGFRSNIIPTESCNWGESNGGGCKEFGEELAEDVGLYRRIDYSALIRIINASFSGWAFTSLLFRTPEDSLQFWTVFSGVWGISEIEICVSLVEFPEFGMFLGRKSVVRWDFIGGNV